MSRQEEGRFRLPHRSTRAWRRTSLCAAAFGVAAVLVPPGLAAGQTMAPIPDPPAYASPSYAPPSYPSPSYGSPSYGSSPSYARPSYGPPPSAAFPSGTGQISYADTQTLQAALAAAKSGAVDEARNAMSAMSDPLARKIAQWALQSAGSDALSWAEQSSGAFGPGWPRSDRGQIAAANEARVAEAQAEFEAGWTALTRLNDPRSADSHFARLQTLGDSPLTQSRAYYWRGRAAEAMGDPVDAQLFYAQAARWPTAFYGQLAAAKVGSTVISLGRDPVITSDDRAAFEGNDAVAAARLLDRIGAKDLFKTFVVALSEALPDAAQEALLVDLARQEGEQALSMKVVRNAARRGLILPERGYPVRTAGGAYGGPESAFVLGIVRQESGFDPMAHSGAGARGMMQLMPATAQGVARRLGLGEGDLYDAAYNMTVGSAFLGQLVSNFGGSYVMAAAAYNAGPGRPPQWAAACGDPRSASTDPINFIECIPFAETRDYVMRVLEATEVYRARLAGGAAPNTLPADLRRGGYGYGSYGAASGSAGGAGAAGR